MVAHGKSSAGSYLADPTSLILSHCASIVATSTLRVNLVHADELRTVLQYIIELHTAQELIETKG